MRLRIKITSFFITASILISTLAGTTANAAGFTKKDLNNIHRIQEQYALLPKMRYNQKNIYHKEPHLSEPFDPGILSAEYISSQLAYINYYRSMFGLNKINTDSTNNDNAQIAASVMAAAQASPFVNQHGLPSLVKPPFISDMFWNIAKIVTASSNLNFNINNQTAGEVVTDLLTDRFNLDGSDTGHRAWLLSTKISKTGIGAAYGDNGYRYSVQQVAFAADSYAAPCQTSVLYPASNLFPIELLQGSNIAWSLYLSEKRINHLPKITITDLDDNQSYKVNHVNNFSKQGFGYFSTIITYYPANMPLILGHQYEVNIHGLYKYTFKLFSLDPTKPLPLDTDDSNNAQKIKSALLSKAEKLRDSLNKDRAMNINLFGKSYQDGKQFYNLGAQQWFHDFFVVDVPDLTAGIIDITDKTIDKNIYTSPYKQYRRNTFTQLQAGKSYAYGQIIQINKTNWYYLGPHRWFRQQISRHTL